MVVFGVGVGGAAEKGSWVGVHFCGGWPIGSGSGKCCRMEEV